MRGPCGRGTHLRQRRRMPHICATGRAAEPHGGQQRLTTGCAASVRRGSRIVLVVIIIAVGVNTDGRREVPGMEIGTSEAEPIWTEFLRKLNWRGLCGVKRVVSDAHEGIKAAVSKALRATWQRCRVHFLRNVLAHA